MKKLKGTITDKDNQTPFEAERVVLELGNDRRIVITPSQVRGNEGIHLGCGIDRKNVASNGRFVLRPGSFNGLEITIEQIRQE